MEKSHSIFFQGDENQVTKGLSWAGILLALLLASSPAVGQITFVVNSLGDDGQESNSAGLLCFTGNTIPPQIPECTFRAALESANAASEPVVIEFWSGIETLNGRSEFEIGSALPFIDNQITIDGTTHPLYQGNNDVRVHLRYTGSSTGTLSGIRFSSSGGGSGSTVRAIGILSFPGSGILLNGGNGYVIEKNHIGTAWQNVGSSGGRIGNHGIDLNGASDTGLGVTTIRDNIISRTDGHGIVLRGGTRATMIYDNIIGLYQIGSTAFGAFDGAQIEGAGVFIAVNAGPDNFIGTFGANVISFAKGGGIIVRRSGQSITRNLIGLPPNFQPGINYELTDYGNSVAGIILESDDNIVGGTAAAMNYIGNNSPAQIVIGNSGSSAVAANDNQIRTNMIGITPDGDNVGGDRGIRIDNGDNTSIRNTTIANHDFNITVRGSGNQIHRNTISNAAWAGIEMRGTGNIGSADADDGNLFIENAAGIRVDDTGAGITHIRNNFFGVDEDGNDLGNIGGVIVADPDNMVNIFENTFGFNQYGVQLQSSASGTRVQGNRIGELADGTPVPNQVGVWVLAGSPFHQLVDHLIGGSITTDLSVNTQIGNLIANSTEYGVILEERTNGNLERVTVRGNTFRNNATGITLWPPMTEIDPGGAEEGPNDYLNWPELDEEESWLDPETGEIHFRVRVNTTTANASYPLLIDFYRHSGDAAAQGETYLGSLDYAGSTAAQWITGTLEPVTPVSIGEQIVATASDSDGNTSQFTLNPLTLEPEEPLPDELYHDRFEED